MKTVSSLIGALAALGGLAITTGLASAETLKMQTFLGATAPTTIAFEKLAADLKAATNGEVDISVLPGGAVVGVTETLGAIEAGVLDGQYTAPSYFAGKDPAMGVLGDTLAAFPDPDTRNRWFTEGGGDALAAKVYDKYALHYVCNVYWPVEQIPSKVAITTIDDLKGLKMRAPGGLASDLLTKAGASLVTMSVPDSVTAMETGFLDAIDLANIALNDALGMYGQAKFSVLARHSMATTSISVSQAKWDALSEDAKTKFTSACSTMSDDLRMTLIAQDQAAAEKVQAEGVTLIEFGADDQKKFRDITLQVWSDWGAKAPDAAEIVASLNAFVGTLGLE